jgi:hypothetical protein
LSFFRGENGYIVSFPGEKMARGKTTIGHRPCDVIVVIRNIYLTTINQVMMATVKLSK